VLAVQVPRFVTRPPFHAQVMFLLPPLPCFFFFFHPIPFTPTRKATFFSSPPPRSHRGQSPPPIPLVAPFFPRSFTYDEAKSPSYVPFPRLLDSFLLPDSPRNIATHSPPDFAAEHGRFNDLFFPMRYQSSSRCCTGTPPPYSFSADSSTTQDFELLV